MTRQYTNKRSSRQHGGVPHQFLVIIGTFLLGYLTATLWGIETVTQWLNEQVFPSHEPKQQLTKAPDYKSAVPPKPKFEFYTLLTNDKPGTATVKSNAAVNATAAANHATAASTAGRSNEVTLPPPRLSSAPESTPSELTSSSAAQKPYSVQVAAFKSRHDAEEVKARLTLKGFNVTVVPVTHAQGTWFRVIVGPYANKAQALQAQLVLVKNERLKGIVFAG